ncbi:restriction endonuclease subunit S [Cyanothece sp. BG0011]|uniref:restriction endonuclease subunit S n=1 Tax=Cyanothece sp. BG0011 TaxID=2082950 RepID=UPI000D1E120A|nr:restriction endonuclease subunit S [Cyanothece sp. BG0011]
MNKQKKDEENESKSYESKRLKEIATIKTGYPLKSQEKANSQREIKVIYMSDIDENNVINWHNLETVEINNLDNRHLLKHNDILFCSRGVTNKVAMVSNPPDGVISATPLTVIRPHSTLVNPAYLTWYLNHPRTQYEISRFAKGTSLLMISKEDLGKLNITLPPLSKQQLILEIQELNLKEQQIIQDMAHKKQKLTDKLLWKIAQGEIN